MVQWNTSMILCYIIYTLLFLTYHVIKESAIILSSYTTTVLLLFNFNIIYVVSQSAVFVLNNDFGSRFVLFRIFTAV